MVALVILIFISSLIFWLQRKIWSLEKNIVFPIVTVVFYFWSLAGAWLFILDQLTGVGKSIGLGYYYLMEKMFKVELDSTYAFVILLYGLFIIVFQFFLLMLLKSKLNKSEKIEKDKHVIQISSIPIVLVAIISIVGSFIIVKDVIYYSLILNESVYINVRSSGVNNYSIHQYFNWTMIVCLYVYIGLYYSKGIRFIHVKKPSILFWIIFLLGNFYLVFIGSRHETFLAGIIALLLISFPNRSIRKSLKLYVVFGLFFTMILALNDPIRALLPRICSKTGITKVITTPENKKKAQLFQLDRSFIVHQSVKKTEEYLKQEELKDITVSVYKDSLVLLTSEITLNKKEYFEQIKEHSNYLIIEGRQYKLPNPKISGAYNNLSLTQKILHSITSIVFSNELFAGHFSLYGILKYEVNPKIGISFKAFLELIKPKSSRNPDVLDSYRYYAKELNFPDGQGFTINHISAWYLNFSYFGILIGSTILSFLIFIFYTKQQNTTSGTKELLWLLVLCSVVAFCAMLVRSGPEAYKSLIVEAIIIPVLIYYCAIWTTKLFSVLKSKFKN